MKISKKIIFKILIIGLPIFCVGLIITFFMRQKNTIYMFENGIIKNDTEIDTAWWNKNSFDSIEELEKHQKSKKTYSKIVYKSLNDTVIYVYKDSLFKHKIFTYKTYLNNRSTKIGINNDTVYQNQPLVLTIGSTTIENFLNVKITNTPNGNNYPQIREIVDNPYSVKAYEIKNSTFGVNHLYISYEINGKEYLHSYKYFKK